MRHLIIQNRKESRSLCKWSLHFKLSAVRVSVCGAFQFHSKYIFFQREMIIIWCWLSEKRTSLHFWLPSECVCLYSDAKWCLRTFHNKNYPRSFYYLCTSSITSCHASQEIYEIRTKSLFPFFRTILFLPRLHLNTTRSSVMRKYLQSHTVILLKNNFEKTQSGRSACFK